jgi:C1A family cysteine protease
MDRRVKDQRCRTSSADAALRHMSHARLLRATTLIALLAALASGEEISGHAEKTPAENSELSARVDLRPRFAEWRLTQRFQGERGTCSVFATVEAVEFALANCTGKGEHLSVEFANWAANSATGRKDDGDFFHNIIRGISKFGICPERAMPYEQEFAPTREPSADAFAEAARIREKHEIAFHWIRKWSAKPGLEESDIAKVKSVLASGFPVSAGSYHSLLFVGYEDNASLPGGGRFIVADSEGRERYLDYGATMKRMSDLFWVSASLKAAQ